MKYRPTLLKLGIWLIFNSFRYEIHSKECRANHVCHMQCYNHYYAVLKKQRTPYAVLLSPCNFVCDISGSQNGEGLPKTRYRNTSTETCWTSLVLRYVDLLFYFFNWFSGR
jgi:hypothetical protein